MIGTFITAGRCGSSRRVAACNSVEGVGEDVLSAGKAVESTAADASN